MLDLKPELALEMVESGFAKSLLAMLGKENPPTGLLALILQLCDEKRCLYFAQTEGGLESIMTNLASCRDKPIESEEKLDELIDLFAAL